MEGTDRPTIAIVDNSVQVTGAFKCIFHNVLKLKSKFRFIFIVSKDATHLNLLAENGLEYHELPFMEIHKSAKMVFYKKQLKRNTRSLMEILEKEKVDLLHVNDLYNMVGYKIKKQLPNLPLIYHVRLKKDSYIKRFHSYFAKRIKIADRILAMSYACSEGIDARHLEVVYDTMNFNEQHPAYAVRTEAPYKILCLSNMIKGKGQDLVLEAFYHLLKRRTDVELHFVGGSPNDVFKLNLQNKLNAYGISKKVVFKSFVEDVELEMKSADIVVNFSLSESFSMVCLEAQSYGVPVISSDCGGPNEIIDNGITGQIVPNGNVGALTNAMDYVLSDTDIRKAFSKESKVHVREKFSEENTTRRLLEIYQTLISK